MLERRRLACRPAVRAMLLTVSLVAGVGLSGWVERSPAVAVSPPGDLIVNGSFEDPVVESGNFGEYSSITGWTAATPGCSLELQRMPDETSAAYDGDQVAELDSDCYYSESAPSIQQTVATAPGTVYRLTYAFSPRPHVAANDLRVSVDGGVLAEHSADGSENDNTAWQVFTQTFTASTAQTTLTFASLDPVDTYGTLVDDVSLVAASPYTDPAAVAQNTSWPNAAVLPNATTVTAANGGSGEARWYRFPIVPGSTVQVDVAGLSADADLTLFGDIGAAFTTLISSTDLPKLSAEFAGDAFSPSLYSPSLYSPSLYSPSLYSPSLYSPSLYSPSLYSPSLYSPSLYSPSLYSPSLYSPSLYSPSLYSPSLYSPSQAFLDAFSGAQTRSLIGVSSHLGAASESITAPTWNNTGNFYVRVQTRDTAGATPFTIRLTTTGGACNGFTLDTGTGVPLPATPGSPGAVILTDTARLGLTGAAKTAYVATLAQLAASANGVVVDAADVARTRLLNTQADAHPQCTYAKNLVAQSLRDIVNAYRTPSLKYVVIAGADPVVPFFRYPDTSGLGPESDYVPPVRDDSASQASLRTNNVLGQDAYGTVDDVTVKGSVLPVPDLASVVWWRPRPRSARRCSAIWGCRTGPCPRRAARW